MRDTEAVPGMAAILCTLVGMNDNRLDWASSPNSHWQCVKNELLSQRQLHGSTNNLACEEIDDDGQV